MTTRNEQTSKESRKAHWIEWLTGVVSACLVLAMLGWIIHDAMRQTGEPPDLSIIVTATDRLASGAHRVRFEIANASTSTAAAVTVGGELHDGETVTERSEVTFDYVPAESKTRGALYFRADPQTRNMTISIMGYTEP